MLQCVAINCRVVNNVLADSINELVRHDACVKVVNKKLQVIRKPEEVVMTRSFLVAALVTMAVVVLFGSTARGQENPSVIGQVVSATGITQNGNPLPAGGTIFDGVVLTADAAGEAVIKLSPTSQVAVRPNTSVRFAKILTRKVLQIHSGNILVENVGKDFTLIQTPKFNIRPSTGQASRIYVGLMTDNTTYIEAAEGDVEIEDIKSSRAYTLPAGQNTFVPESAEGVPGLESRQPTPPPTPAQAAPATPQPTQPKPASHNTALIAGIAAAAGIGGVVAAVAGSHGGGGGGQPVSPSAP